MFFVPRVPIAVFHTTLRCRKRHVRARLDVPYVANFNQVSATFLSKVRIELGLWQVTLSQQNTYARSQQQFLETFFWMTM